MQVTTTEMLFKALNACLPYMKGLESDNIEDRSVGWYKDHELTEAYELAKKAVETKVDEMAKERRMFAAMALQGILSNQQLLVNIESVDGGAEAWAVMSADALLLELEKTVQ